MNQNERTNIRERLLKVDTSNVADVLDEMALYDQGLSSAFVPYPANGGKLAGFAYTIQGCKFRGNPPPDSEMISPPSSEN